MNVDTEKELCRLEKELDECLSYDLPCEHIDAEIERIRIRDNQKQGG